MFNLILNILLGVLFEVFFITLVITNIKNVKEHRIKLFIAILISYIISGILVKFDTSYLYQYIVYIILTIMAFISCKIIYKDKANVTDIFLIYYSIMAINYTSLISIKLIDYNYFSMLLSRVLLIICMVISLKLNKPYKTFLYNWNRHKDNKIKSITVRNFTIIIANFLLVIINYYLINYLNIILS